MSGKLPPYSDLPTQQDTSSTSMQQIAGTASRIAGNVVTCSIRDGQVDYLKIVRESPTSFHICLTVDPTPLYRIKLASEKTLSIAGDVQIFPANSPEAPPIAGARLLSLSKNKKDPVAMICTSGPSHPQAAWRPISRPAGSSTLETYLSSIPIVTVPGIAPTHHQFTWRTTYPEPFYELWWQEGPLPFASQNGYFPESRDRAYVFATISRRAHAAGNNLIEIRRGGGFEFEMSVILGMFVCLHHAKKELL